MERGASPRDVSRDLPVWACPACHGPLEPGRDGLRCAQCSGKYPVRDGIPLLLADGVSYGDLVDHFDERVQSRGDDAAFYLRDLPSLFSLPVRWNVALRMRIYGVALRSVTGRVLDIGCGTGSVSASLASDPETEVYGVDLSVEALRIARRKGLIPAQASATALPFPGGTFDTVLCLSVLPYFDDPRPLLQEIRRTLKPRGRLLLSSVAYDGIRRLTRPVMEWILRRRGQTPHIVRRDRVDDLIPLLTESGMRVTRFHTMHFPFPLHGHPAQIRWWHRAMLSEVLLEAAPVDGLDHEIGIE